MIADKNYYGREFEAELAAAGLDLLRPARKGEKPRPGTRFFKPLRQVIESVNDTFKGQLDLEQHGGHTPAGVWVRVVQRVLALTAAIWHNDRTGQLGRAAAVAPLPVVPATRPQCAPERGDSRTGARNSPGANRDRMCRTPRLGARRGAPTGCRVPRAARSAAARSATRSATVAGALRGRRFGGAVRPASAEQPPPRRGRGRHRG